MIDETLKNIPIIDEAIIDKGNGKFAVTKDDVPNYIESDEYDYSAMNNRKNFEDLLKWKGIAGKWAYDHNIGLYARRRLHTDKSETGVDASTKARARFIAQESWYDEDNYFWIKIDEYPKPLICQLRVSNHITDFKKHYETHSNEPLGIVNCDTILNLKILDKQALKKAGKKPKEGWTRMASTSQKYVDSALTWTMFSVEVTLDLNDPDLDPVGLQLFEMFLQEVKEGKQPTITIDDLRQWIDPDAYVRINEYYDNNNPGQLYVRPGQLTARENLKSNQWTMAPSVNKDFTRYAIPRFADDPVDYNELTLDKTNPIFYRGDKCYYGKFDGKNIRYNTKKHTITRVDKKGKPLGNGTMFVTGYPLTESRFRRKKLIESFVLSPLYLHNIIIESIEKLL